MWAGLWREQPLHCCFPWPCVPKPWLVQVACGSLLSDWRGDRWGGRGEWRRMEMEQPRSGWKGWRPSFH